MEPQSGYERVKHEVTVGTNFVFLDFYSKSDSSRPYPDQPSGFQEKFEIEFAAKGIYKVILCGKKVGSLAVR